jgi:hypothetical protein
VASAKLVAVLPESKNAELDPNPKKKKKKCKIAILMTGH